MSSDDVAGSSSTERRPQTLAALDRQNTLVCVDPVGGENALHTQLATLRYSATVHA